MQLPAACDALTAKLIQQAGFPAYQVGGFALDGMRFGFGTEVGISTNKVHARGPVGLDGLMIHEYRLSGNGQGAAMYGGSGGKQYKHKRLPLS